MRQFTVVDVRVGSRTDTAAAICGVPLESTPQKRTRIGGPYTLGGAIMPCMKVEEIAEAIAKLPPDQLVRFRRWFTAFEAGRADHAKELDSTATKLGRLAGRVFAELKKRGRNRERERASRDVAYHKWTLGLQFVLSAMPRKRTLSVQKSHALMDPNGIDNKCQLWCQKARF